MDSSQVMEQLPTTRLPASEQGFTADNVFFQYGEDQTTDAEYQEGAIHNHGILHLSSTPKRSQNRNLVDPQHILSETNYLSLTSSMESCSRVHSANGSCPEPRCSANPAYIIQPSVPSPPLGTSTPNRLTSASVELSQSTSITDASDPTSVSTPGYETHDWKFVVHGTEAVMPVRYLAQNIVQPDATLGHQHHARRVETSDQSDSGNSILAVTLDETHGQHYSDMSLSARRTPEPTNDCQPMAESQRMVPVAPSLLMPHPAFSNPTADAAILHVAMENGDTRWPIVIKVLARRTYVQRRKILKSYYKAYGKSLLLSLSRGQCPHFKRLALALMISPCELLAYHLHQALRTPDTDGATLVEILLTRSFKDISVINAFYLANYNRPLLDDLRGDNPNHLRRLLVEVTRKNRDLFTTDLYRAPELAQQLHKACEGRTVIDQLIFGMILSSFSFHMLRAIFEEYRAIKGKSLVETIESEFSDDENGLEAVVMSIDCRSLFLAKRLRDALQGSTNCELTLIRMVVTKTEVDFGTVLRAYESQYGRLSEEDFLGNIPTDYKMVILDLLQEAN